MGSIVRHLTSLRRSGGKAAAVIAGAGVAMLCTGTAFAANMTSTPEPPSAVHMSAAARHNPYKPRTGGGRDAVLLGPARRAAAGQLVPGRPLLLDAVPVG